MRGAMFLIGRQALRESVSEARRRLAHVFSEEGGNAWYRLHFRLRQLGLSYPTPLAPCAVTALRFRSLRARLTPKPPSRLYRNPLDERGQKAPQKSMLRTPPILPSRNHLISVWKSTTRKIWLKTAGPQ
jgi:hypothetical protein